MSRFSMILLVASVTVASALVVDRSDAAMRPDVAAKALTRMENTWAAQAYAFTGCATTGADFNCKEAPKAFAESCTKFAGQSIKVATKENVVEYMNDICTNMKLGWHQATCQKAGTLIDAEMSASGYENRKSAEERAQKACRGFWLHSVTEQEAKAKKEKAKKEEGKAKEEEDSKKESAQESKEEKEAKNAKPVSFLQVSLQMQVSQAREAGRLQAQMMEGLSDVPDDLRHPSAQTSLVQERSRQLEKDRQGSKHRHSITADEAHKNSLRRNAELDATKKKWMDWAQHEMDKQQHRNTMIERLNKQKTDELANNDFVALAADGAFGG